MSKLKLFTLLGILFILSTTYAAEWDNVGDYDSDTKTITITNALGLGSDLANITLNTPLVVNTFAGYQKVAEFTIYNSEEYEKFFNDMKFYDMNKDEREINRNFDLKYKKYYQITVNDYETNCSTRQIVDKLLNASKDGTITEKYNCTSYIIGNHTVDKFNWIDLELTNLSKGTIEVGLFANVKSGDYVEWIPELFGVKIDDWAVWTSALSIDILSFHKLNESTSTISVDSVDYVNNATLGSTLLWNDSGFINASIAVKGLASNYQTRIWNSSFYKFGLNKDFTISTWIYVDTITTSAIIDNGGCGGSSTAISLWIRDNRFQFGSGVGGTENTVYSNQSISIGQWYHVAGVRQGGNYSIYVDSILTNITTFGSGQDTSNQDLTIDKNYLMMGWRSCGGASGDLFLDGRIDEVGIWNRSLSTSEIEQLYNGGSGITYLTDTTQPPEVNLISPPNNTIQNQTIINFNCSAVDNTFVQNISLYIDGVLNYTETFGSINDTSISQNRVLVEGVHNWTCESYDDVGELGITNTWFINIDSTNPVIVINTPTSSENIVTFSLPTNITLNALTVDPQIDSCWYYTSDNSTNQIYTCNTTQYPSFESEGEKIIYVLANDTINNIGSQSVVFNITFLSYIQSDSQDPTSEGNIVTFDIYINKTNIGSTNATFTYNNTNYLPDTTTISTDYYYFTKTLTIPDGDGNSTGNVIPWYWEFTVINIINDFKTDNETLTIFSVEFDNCSTFSTHLIDIFLLDENTDSYIISNVTRIDVNLNLTNSVSDIVWNFNSSFYNDTNVSICVADNVLNYSSFSLDFVGSYVAETFVKEFYYIDGKEIDSITVPEIINMRDLPLSDSTTFLFTFKDEFDFQRAGVVVEVLRLYIGDGVYRIIEREITGSEGQTNLHLIEEDAVYKFNIYENEVLIFQSADYKALCDVTPCTIILTQLSGITEFETDLTNLDGTYSWSSNSLSRTVAVNFTLEQTQTMNLSIYVVNQTSSQDILISTTSLTGTTGVVISPSIPNEYGNQTFYGVLTTNNATQSNMWVSSQWIDFNQKLIDIIGVDVWFYAAMVVIVFALLGLATGPFVIIFTILALIMLSVLSFINLQASITLFVIGGGVIIWKMISRRY